MCFIRIRKNDAESLHQSKESGYDFNTDMDIVILTDQNCPQHGASRVQLNASNSLNFSMITVAQLIKCFFILFIVDVYRKVQQYNFCNFLKINFSLLQLLHLSNFLPKYNTLICQWFKQFVRPVKVKATNITPHRNFQRRSHL